MVVSYRVKRCTKHGERELLSGMMFPQAAPTPLLKAFSFLSQQARGDARKGKRAIEDDL
jgi:hypothetical protein